MSVSFPIQEFNLNREHVSPFSTILFSIICFPIILFVQDTVSIHFLDISQGDTSGFISSNDEVSMIGSGYNESLISKYLQNLRISQIDFLITTHPRVNYITVMDKIVDRYVSILVEINSTNYQNFTEKDSMGVPLTIKSETNIIKLQE